MCGTFGTDQILLCLTFFNAADRMEELVWTPRMTSCASVPLVTWGTTVTSKSRSVKASPASATTRTLRLGVLPRLHSVVKAVLQCE